MPTPGIASALLIIDDFEIGLVSSGLLPDLVGIPLVIQDKTFVPRTSSTKIQPGNGAGRATSGTPTCMNPTRVPPGDENPKGRWD